MSFVEFTLPNSPVGSWRPTNLVVTEVELWLYTPSGVLLLVAFGLVFGSFLNTVIHRLPLMLQRDETRYVLESLHIEPPALPRLSLSQPASFCPNCHRKIHKVNLIPLVSWFWLRGRCDSCNQPISVRYPLVEALTALLVLLAYFQYGLNVHFCFSVFFCLCLLTMAFIDWEKGWLPDVLTVPLIGVGLLYSVVNASGLIGVSPTDAIVGAFVGYLVFSAINFGYKLWRGEPGMGGGDVKLAAAIGAWFGWVMLPVVVFAATVVATVFAIFLIGLRRYDRRTGIRYAPFVSIAAILLYFARDTGFLPHYLTL